MSSWSVPGYQEVRELGVGGSGRVVLATYKTTGAYVAIKYLRDELRHHPGFLSGFRQEAHVMAELDTPDIVRLYEYVETPEGAAIVMELIDGVSLRKILSEYGTTSPEAALVVLKGSFAGLSAAHASGIVHRDYKPENVLIQADGASKLSDFGIAVPSGDPGVPAGTPPYMAPEQWDSGPAGPATDVYAATCVFFECLTGHKPYRADHVAGLRHQHQNAPIPVMDVPSSVRSLVARGLAKNPMDRPPTARAFLSELEVAAIAAYGPDWEQRGRRHLAELAVLLALVFPLAKPTAAPEVGTTLARTVLANRFARFAPRFAIGATLLSAVVIAGVIAANRQTPVAQDRTLPPQTEHAQQVASPPVESSPGAGPTRGPRPPDPVEPTSPATHAGDPQGATKPPSATPPPTPFPTATPKPTPSAKPTPTPTPSPSAKPTPQAVTSLGITGFDGQSATIHVKASTTQKVNLTVRFSEGPSTDKLVASAPQTIPLVGATSYDPGVQHGFATPRCGTTVFRRVEASTVPKAPGGTTSTIVQIDAPPCPSPTVQNVTITSWDGAGAAVAVRTDNPGELKVTAKFSRDSEPVGTESVTLSGKMSYSFETTSNLGDVACGDVAVLGVKVATDPAAANGVQTKEVRVSGPKCPAPDDSPGRPSIN